MAIKNNIFEDLARISTSVATVAFESVKNAQEGIRSKTKSFATSADLVSRAEFEVLKAIVSRVRIDNETMLKEAGEFKQQIRAIKTTLDILKEQIGKNPAAAAEANPKIFEELDKINSSLEGRMKSLEGKMQSQVSNQINQQFAKIEGFLKEVKAEVAAQTESIEARVAEAQKQEVKAAPVAEIKPMENKVVEIKAETEVKPVAKKSKPAKVGLDILNPKKAAHERPLSLVPPAASNNSIALLNSLSPANVSDLDLFASLDLNKKPNN